MNVLQSLAVSLVAGSLAFGVQPASASTYPWLSNRAPLRTIESAIAPPPGFARIPLGSDTFGAWLRGLPLLADGAPVLLHTGKPKPMQWGYLAVVDLDVGTSDLQQCADSIMRLRAEYLWSVGRQRDIAFNTGKGRMTWQGKGRPAFAQYLRQVFSYAGTATMQRELARPQAGHRLVPGDVLVRGGSPGHAVLVLDAADDKAGRRVVLLGQGYMPAQQFQVMNRPGQASPWYDPEDLAGAGLNTSLWFKRFVADDVRVYGEKAGGRDRVRAGQAGAARLVEQRWRLK